MVTTGEGQAGAFVEKVFILEFALGQRQMFPSYSTSVLVLPHRTTIISSVELIIFQTLYNPYYGRIRRVRY